MALDPFSTDSSTALEPNLQGASVTPVNTTTDPYGFNPVDINTSASSFAIEPAAGGPNLQIITRNDNIVQNRMVFSTVNEEPRGARTLTLRNSGNQALTVTGLNFGNSQEKYNAVPGRLADHERRADFKFANAVRLPINLAPGASTDIRLLFRPQRTAIVDVNDSPTHTINGENYASLTINSNDPDGPTKVNLAGLNSANYEGDNEPSLAEIIRTFGWTTNIGSEDNRLGLSKKLFGDEVYSPYWVRADASQPVLLFPMAVYSSRSDNPHDSAEFRAKAGTGGKSGLIYTLPGRLNDDNIIGSNDLSGGENQKLLPKILINGRADVMGSLPVSTTVDFSPTSPFALKRGSGWTDDNQNGPDKTRAWRIYPLKSANGVVVPNTWIATTDIGTNVGRNGDFNDDVYLFKNARPASQALNPAAPSLISDSSDLTLNPPNNPSGTNTGSLVPGSDGLIYNFNKTYPTDSLKDKDNQTIGFTSVQLNKNDGDTSTASYKPSLLDLDLSTDTLRVTTDATAGTNGGNDNTLVNGLQTNFDGRAGRAMITTKLLGSLSYLDAGVEQAGVMFGPNDDSYIKLVARALPNGGGTGLEFYFEDEGLGARRGELLPILNPESVQSLELKLLTDPQAGTVRAAYEITRPTGAIETGKFDSFVVLKGDDLGKFFAAQSKAGIITSNKGGTPFTATFDQFAIKSNETAVSARTVLHRLDVGRDSSYTDPFGRTWSSDVGFFTPSDAISETGANSSADIAKTRNDEIYRTYRAKLGPGTMPLEDRILSYNLPVSSPGAYDVRLHFAEIFFGVPGVGPAGSGIGSRVFDVVVEGKTVLPNFDITAAAGSPLTAVVVPIEDVQVNDGTLDIDLKADVNFGSLSGIEVLQKA